MNWSGRNQQVLMAAAADAHHAAYCGMMCASSGYGAEECARRRFSCTQAPPRAKSTVGDQVMALFLSRAAQTPAIHGRPSLSLPSDLPSFGVLPPAFNATAEPVRRGRLEEDDPDDEPAVVVIGHKDKGTHNPDPGFFDDGCSRDCATCSYPGNPPCCDDVKCDWTIEVDGKKPKPGTKGTQGGSDDPGAGSGCPSPEECHDLLVEWRLLNNWLTDYLIKANWCGTDAWGILRRDVSPTDLFEPGLFSIPYPPRFPERGTGYINDCTTLARYYALATLASAGDYAMMTQEGCCPDEQQLLQQAMDLTVDQAAPFPEGSDIGGWPMP